MFSPDINKSINTQNNKQICERIAAGIFIVCLIIGFALATLLSAGGDEVVSLRNILRSSYLKIFLGQLTMESNNFPGFYLIQKLICDISGYPFKEHLETLYWGWAFRDLPASLILRIFPNVCISLAFSFMFYFFSRYYSWWTAIYSLFLAGTSYMTWIYWADGRPYAVWYFLTTAQFFTFLRLVEDKENRKLWQWLVIINISLCFTVVFSVLQVFLISFLLWLMVSRQWHRYIMVTVIPTIICYLYILPIPKSFSTFFFDDKPPELISSGFSKERLLILFVFGLILLYVGVQKKTKIFDRKLLLASFPALMVTMLTLLSAILLLFTFMLRPGPHAPVVNRYMVFLTPVAVIGTTIFSYHLIKSLRNNKTIQIMAILILAGLMIGRIPATISLISTHYFTN